MSKSIADVVAQEPKANILAYGVSGVGKTFFIKSIMRALNKTKPGTKGYIFNFEDNNLWPLADYEQPGLIEYDDYKGYDPILQKIVSFKRFSPDNFPYGVVIIDGGNTMHRIVMEHVLLLGKRELPQIQDYGLAQERMVQRVKDLLSLPCHIYFTFHEQLEKDELTGKTSGRILVPGAKLPDMIPPLFNMWLHFDMTTTKGGIPKRVVRCMPDPTFGASDKFGALLPVEEPDFQIMWDKVLAKVKSNQGAKNATDTSESTRREADRSLTVGGLQREDSLNAPNDPVKGKEN